MSVNDALGQLVDVWEQSDSAGTLGNLKRVDQKGGDSNSANWRVRTFTYDSLSRLLTATNPECGQITWTYDSDSNVVTKLDAKGTTITYNYDALHRVATTGSTHAKSYSNGDAPVDYYFDQTLYNGLQIYEQVGHQTGMADASGSTAWSFDSEGRTVTEKRTILGVTKSIGYAYNLDGSQALLTYPSGRVVTYAYSAAGRANYAKDLANSINYVTGATYAPPGALSGYVNAGRSPAPGLTTIACNPPMHSQQLECSISIAATPQAKFFILLTVSLTRR